MSRLRWPDSTNSVSEKPGTIQSLKKVKQSGAPVATLSSFVEEYDGAAHRRSSPRAGKFRSSQLGKCEWPCGTRRLLPRAEMRASMKGPAERGGHRDEKVPLRTWPAGHRGVHRSRNHRHRQPRRRWLWRDASVGRPVLGGRHGHPPGYGGPRGSRRAARARGSHPRQPRQPADPGGRTRPDHGHDPGGNAAFQTGNLIGASLGLSLLSGLPQEALALVVGGLAAGLLLTGTYQTIQNALVCLVGLMSIVFCAVAGLTAPDIGDLIAGVLIPRLPPGSLLTVLALIGTTFVSYNLFLHASTALERWPDASRNDENIRESRRDTVFSVVLGGLITAAVVVAASPLLGQGAERGERRRGRRTPGTAPRSRRAGLLRPRALRSRADLGDHRPARRRLRGGRGARVAAGPSERPIPSALGMRARHRRVLRRRAGWLAVLRHPAGAGGERSRTPTHADLAAHGRQQDEDHGGHTATHVLRMYWA